METQNFVVVFRNTSTPRYVFGLDGRPRPGTGWTLDLDFGFGLWTLLLLLFVIITVVCLFIRLID